MGLLLLVMDLKVSMQILLLPKYRLSLGPLFLNGQRIKFLDEFKIDWVIWGPEEKRIGSWDPNSLLELKRVFISGDYELFFYNKGK